MRIDIFLLLLALNWELYVLALILSIALLLPIFIKYTLGWFDPLRISVIFAMFANAIPFFLTFTHQILFEILIYFILSETLFWVGLIHFANHRSELNPKYTLAFSEKIGYQVFLISFTLYLLFTLFSYIKLGIPLFLDKSRLSVYADTGGLGILGRFNSFFSIYSLFYSFYLIYQRKKRILAYTALTISTIFLIFTGSKSAFLNVLFAYWGFSYFQLRQIPQTKKVFLYLLLGIGGAIFILIMQTASLGGNLNTASIGFFVRLAASGDTYFYAYPNEMYKIIEVGNPFVHLFQGILKPIRFIQDADAISAGNQLAWIITPSAAGQNLGPNARMPLLSYILWGWGGLIFSYIAGLILSFSLFRLPAYFPKSIISAAFITYIYIFTISGITDFGLCINYWFDYILNFGFLIGLVYVLTRRLSKSPSSKLY